MISGSILREARLRAGLSQAAFAHRAGVAPSAIGRWERGEALPSLERLQMLLGAVDLVLPIGLARRHDHDDALIRRALRQEPTTRLATLVDVVATLVSMERATRG